MRARPVVPSQEHASFTTPTVLSEPLLSPGKTASEPLRGPAIGHLIAQTPEKWSRLLVIYWIDHLGRQSSSLD